MRSRFSIAALPLLALACLAVSCGDDSPTTPDPPDPVPSQWSEWRNLPPWFTTYALWPASANNVFAVGPAGTAARWNGTRWTRLQVGLVRDVWSVAGVPGGRVVAVGDRGSTFLYDGVGFAPNQFVTTANLRSVWVASPDTMLVVGETGTLLLGDGVDWSLQEPPIRRSLLSIWGTSTRDVFAVGPGGTIVHFDGSTWTEQPSGTTETLASISGAASDDVYAVGTAGTILHYDGQNWLPMTSPTRDVLQCVAANAGTPIAVGANGTALELVGGSWSTIDLETTNWLYSACRADTRAWVGGSFAVRMHDGAEWTSSAPGAVPQFRGICVDNSGLAVVVGDDGYIARGRDDQWTVAEGVDARALYCVHCTQSGELFAGGAQRLLRFDGTEWVVEEDDITTWYGFGESPTTLYVVGSNGSIRRRAGSSWVAVSLPPFNESLRGITWYSGSEAYAVGEFGAMVRYDGNQWVPMSTGTSADIYDVIDNPGDLVRRAFAVGESGALFMLNTQGFTPLESPTSANLYALVRDPSGDILAFGGGAAMLRYHDEAWTVESAPVLQPLFAAWGDGDELFATGGGVSGGVVLRLGPP